MLLLFAITTFNVLFVVVEAVVVCDVVFSFVAVLLFFVAAVVALLVDVVDVVERTYCDR